MTNLYLFPLVTYAIIVIAYYYFNKIKGSFETKTSWVKNGFSLFAVNFSITIPLLYSGIIHSEGIGGLWLFWSAYAISGFVPFVFAPLWAKLNFTTDNQFLLFRFGGKGAKIMHLFRTVYVGWLIVAFLMSFQLLALLKVITFIAGWERYISLGIISILLILITIKNKLSVNIRLDFFNTLLIGIVFIFVLIFLLLAPSSLPESTKIIEFSTIFPINKWNLIVLLFVQTWSVNLFDGSGMEAQRFFSTKNKSNAWKVTILSSSLMVVFSLIMVLINYIGANKFGTPNLQDKEMFILSYLQNGLPTWFLPIVLVALFASFITTFEGMLNWGASYLTIDGYKTYINPKASKRRLSIISVASMLIIVSSSLAITYFNDSLTVLIKILFSITAGVAPVFVLRWFWMRINAWSQISAMISSGVYTLLYQNFIFKSKLEESWQELTSLNQYSVQLIFITIVTTVTWLIVTFITSKDNKLVTDNFKNKLLSNYNLKQNVFKALIFGIGIIMILVLMLKTIQIIW